MCTIKLKDLKLGDIVFSSAKGDTLTHALISTGQSIFDHSEGDSKSVHAAIYAGNGNVIESSGDGIGYSPLDSKHTYLAYRFKEDDADNILAETAADVAYTYYEEYQKNKKAGSYSILDAILSLFKKKDKTIATKDAEDKIWGNEDGTLKTTFCSSFVIRCYEAASIACLSGLEDDSKFLTGIKADFKNTNPKTLQAKLRKSDEWQYKGKIDFK
ncbi:MAG: hypothetical protein ACEPOV_07355 [Hyphomicrobiales bacterium]